MRPQVLGSQLLCVSFIYKPVYHVPIANHITKTQQKLISWLIGIHHESHNRAGLIAN